MAYFQQVGSFADGPWTHGWGITGIAVHQGVGGISVYTASGSQGGLLVRDLEGGLVVTDERSFPVTGGRPGLAGLELVSLGGQEALISFGQGPGARGYWLEQTSDLSAAFTLPVGANTLLALKTCALSPAAGGGGPRSDLYQQPAGAGGDQLDPGRRWHADPSAAPDRHRRAAGL